MSLTLHSLRPAKGAKHTSPKRVGRGNSSGKGTTAGKGTKGQKARTGGRNRLKALGLRRLVMSTPKLRGFRSPYPKAHAVNLGALELAFSAGEKVTLDSLRRKGLVPSSASKAKILGDGSLKKKLFIDGCAVSTSAKEKIEAAGGSIKK